MRVGGEGRVTRKNRERIGGEIEMVRMRVVARERDGRIERDSSKS